MIITLAGFNVEKEILDTINSVEQEALTPEIFSAAYARISRSADDITTLRHKARQDVRKARSSNRTIIFDMGHHSVAEHAVFNFDIIGVSRLALEEIEQFRLVSYTEKSQRYVTLKGDFIIPEEIADPADRELFRHMVNVQNDFYRKAFAILRRDLVSRHPRMQENRSDAKVLEGWAKEDARYILSLSTEGQVGVTINARNLEHLFRRFRASWRAEVREIGRLMYEQIMNIAPSLILFADPSQFSLDTQYSFPARLLEADEQTGKTPPLPAPATEPFLSILSVTPDADHIILAHCLSLYKSLDFPTALQRVKTWDYKTCESLFLDMFKNLEFFDTLPRFFEMAEIVFQARISASNFAQLKRHRIATLIVGDYNTALGCVIPENIRKNNLDGEFVDIIGESNRIYQQLSTKYGRAADYILTNSHRRQVSMKMNLRELYHFVRLRADEHAQWDIRALALRLMEALKPQMPLSSMLLCGKSDFVKTFEKIFHRQPRFLI